MTDARPSFAAVIAVEMRAPLARIELLASQIRRETGTPRAQRLATAISEAVGELDRLIDRSLDVLAPQPDAPERAADLFEVFEALRERVGPALAARGIRWIPSPEPAAIQGDSDRARQAAIHLVRVALASGTWSGTLWLGPIADGPRYGVELVVEPAMPEVQAPEPLEELESFALAQGGLLERSMGEGRDRLRVWLPRRLGA